MTPELIASVLKTLIWAAAFVIGCGSIAKAIARWGGPSRRH